MSRSAEHGSATRRNVLRGVAAGGAAAVVAGAGARVASAGPAGAAAATRAALDVSHATPELVSLLTGYFAADSAEDVAATIAYFSREKITYLDATLGWIYPTWADLRAALAEYLPARPASARSYPTRILGDTTSAMVLFTVTPEDFGGEIRSLGSANFAGGKIVRWVDHWDGRHFGIAGVESQRAPEFPSDFRESTVGEVAAPVMKGVVAALASAFATGDAGRAVALFSDDASFEDLTLHSAIVGRVAITGFLHRALGHLPYSGGGVSVRHTVGSARGGGYEWTAPGAAIPRGAVALELDEHHRISRLTAVWDGSLLSRDPFLALLALTIEE